MAAYRISRSVKVGSRARLPGAAHGRLPEFTNDRIVEAEPGKCRLIVGPLWSHPNDKFGHKG